MTNARAGVLGCGDKGSYPRANVSNREGSQRLLLALT